MSVNLIRKSTSGCDPGSNFTMLIVDFELIGFNSIINQVTAGGIVKYHLLQVGRALLSKIRTKTLKQKGFVFRGKRSWMDD